MQSSTAIRTERSLSETANKTHRGEMNTSSDEENDRNSKGIKIQPVFHLTLLLLCPERK